MNAVTFDCSLCKEPIPKPPRLRGPYLKVCVQCVNERIYQQNWKTN